MGTVILFGIKQAIKIIMGVALTLGVFFGVGWLVDWNAARNARMPADPKLWPYAERLARPDAVQRPHAALPAAPPEKRSAPDAVGGQDARPLEPRQPSSPGGKSLSGPGQTGKALPNEHQQVVVPGKAAERAAAAPLTYTIQLGSFQNAEVTKAFSDSLVAKGYPAYVLQTDVAGKGTVYRVRIGKFTTMEEAQAMAVKIEKKENVSAFITSK